MSPQGLKTKVLFVFGTRPEAIKLAPIINEFKSYPEEFSTVVCVTAQHRQMLDQVLKLFEITPDYDLNIMKANQTLFDITTSAMTGIGAVIAKEAPGVVIVQGDTTTTFAGSLAAFYNKVPVVHIEAGLRTHNKYSPFPEEINRKLSTQMADLHLAPTESARENLLRENIDPDTVLVTGNSVIDALLTVVRKQSSRDEQLKWSEFFSGLNVSFSGNGKMILVTGHRRENFGSGFENICNALKEIALKRPDIDLVYPVHLNPNVQQPVNDILKGIKNIHLIPPLDYEPFVFLLSKAHIVLTDSGGVQEEAPSLGKPILVLRDTTERPEGVQAGTVLLVGTDGKKIIDETLRLLDDEAAYAAMSAAHNPYGDGQAAKKTVAAVRKLKQQGVAV